MKLTKKRVFDIIQIARNNDEGSRLFDSFIVTLIIINIVIVIAETFALPLWVNTVFQVVEVFSVIVFTIEYILRIYTADLLYPELSPTRARVKYMGTLIAVVDLLSILPFYLPIIIPIDLRVLKSLRVVRLLRIFKVNRYNDSLASIGTVLKKKRHQLFSSILSVTLLMVIASILMYGVEHEAQPEAFDNALSAFWWAVSTLTTVGYGDIYPITPFGKILGAFIALLGIGIVAIPTGIISAGFMEQLNKQVEEELALEGEGEEHGQKQYCPYCGKKIN